MKCPFCNREIDDDSNFCVYCGTQVQKDTAQFENFVDLGLPSGLLWKEQNELGFYTYDEAVNRFGGKLPTGQQFEELKNKCTWQWTTQNGVNGYKVTGPNGNSIFLPAAGRRNCLGLASCVCTRGYYWSSTPYASNQAWSLYFYSGRVNVDYGNSSRGQSVRLTQNKYD